MIFDCVMFRDERIRSMTSIFLREVAPRCKCGCDAPVMWDKSRSAWHRFAAGHYRQDAPYKHEAWLRREYTEKGLSCFEIGAACGVSHQTIFRHLRRFGVDPPTRAEKWMIRVAPNAAECENCGGPMSNGNLVGICSRNRECAVEYARRHNQNHTANVDAGRRQPYAHQRRVPPCVYGIHFPGAGVLKVGTSTRLTAHLTAARRGLGLRALDGRDGCQVWSKPGHHLAEVYVQANLSFQFPPKFQGTNRLSEWFDTGSIPVEEIVACLNAIYEVMPQLPVWAAQDSGV